MTITIGRPMLKHLLAGFISFTMTNELSAQTREFSNDLGILFEKHAEAFIKCTESEGYDSKDCQNETTLTRRLMDHGWCRKTGQKDHLFQRCSVYRSYAVIPELNGYQFGFEDSSSGKSFSTEFRGLKPTLSGTYESEIIGKLHIQCSSDSQPLIVVEINKEYPDFAIRSDIVNFVAVIEGVNGTPMARALLSEEGSKGRFYTVSSEIAVRILEYYSMGLDSGDHVILKFNAYNPEATIEFSLSPLIGNLDAMMHSAEVKNQVTELLSQCKTALE